MITSEEKIKESFIAEIKERIECLEDKARNKQQDIEDYSRYMSEAQDDIINLDVEIKVLTDILNTIDN